MSTRDAEALAALDLLLSDLFCAFLFMITTAEAAAEVVLQVVPVFFLSLAIAGAGEVELGVFRTVSIKRSWSLSGSSGDLASRFCVFFSCKRRNC